MRIHITADELLKKDKVESDFIGHVIKRHTKK